MKELPLVGYTDKLSLRPGETIAFKVSSTSAQPYTASLFRSISADPNPDGPGIIEEAQPEFFETSTYPSRHQRINRGSYALGVEPLSISAKEKIDVSVTIYLTKYASAECTVFEIGELKFAINSKGIPELSLGGQRMFGEAIGLKQWCRLDFSIEASGSTKIAQTVLGRNGETLRETTGELIGSLELNGIPVIAASIRDGRPCAHFNGRIEAPSLRADGKIVAAWDFSNSINSTEVPAVHGPALRLVNFPTRAITSSAWDATEMCWRHAPEHYAAIHFHEDDVYDFEWETDFTFKAPDDMPSGIYVMRIQCGANYDAIPFFVCAPKNKPTAKLCVLVSTFTYTIYGNHARPDFGPEWQKRADNWNAYPFNPADYPHYGLSTYNLHTDGSGICHGSHRRPLFNLRPGYITFGNTPCSGLRHFPADSHLISWLHAKGIDYDIITDWELHTEGVDAIKGYAAVTTGTHPEYHTSQTLNALRDYREQGGRLHYLGGNGFYWRIAVHEENESLLEIRRAEDGIRAWAADPGEYYNAFDGSYGGLWRRNARPPQELVGIGFAAQGEFVGSPYQRMPISSDLEWIFDGVDDEIIGDFGLSGGGAAGYELDHCNTNLGTPCNTQVIARSITKDGAFMLVPEEQLTHLTNLIGEPEADILHADMIYVDWPGGGSVFATGSITFCGCLPCNQYENNTSKLLENVLRRAIS